MRDPIGDLPGRRLGAVRGRVPRRAALDPGERQGRRPLRVKRARLAPWSSILPPGFWVGASPSGRRAAPPAPGARGTNPSVRRRVAQPIRPVRTTDPAQPEGGRVRGPADDGGDRGPCVPTTLPSDTGRSRPKRRDVIQVGCPAGMSGDDPGRSTTPVWPRPTSGPGKTRPGALRRSATPVCRRMMRRDGPAGRVRASHWVEPEPRDADGRTR